MPLTIQRRSALTAAAACACCVPAFLMVWPSSSTMRSQLACRAQKHFTRVAEVLHGNQANHVSSSHAVLLCSATSGLDATHREKPIAHLSSASNKREAIMPAISRVKPA